jgi:hypothetical protein
MEKLSKGKQRLLEYLGEPYTTKIIDYENCVYLNMGDYDIEISRGLTIRSKIDIYVWKTKDFLDIVERYLNIKPDLPSIKAFLDDIRSRYPQKTKKES